MTPYSVKSPIGSKIIYNALFCSMGSLGGVCTMFLVKAFYPTLPPIFCVMPWMSLAKIPTAFICHRLGIYSARQAKRVEFVAPGATTPTEAELREKPFPTKVLLLIPLGIVIFQGWDIVTRTNLHPALVAFAAMLVVLAGALALRQSNGDGKVAFTRADAQGITYGRWLESSQTLLWSEIASIEWVETFDEIYNQKKVFWEVRDEKGEHLLTISPYSASPEQRREFSEVVSRYLRASSSV